MPSSTPLSAWDQIHQDSAELTASVYLSFLLRVYEPLKYVLYAALFRRQVSSAASTSIMAPSQDMQVDEQPPQASSKSLARSHDDGGSDKEEIGVLSLLYIQCEQKC